MEWLDFQFETHKNGRMVKAFPPETRVFFHYMKMQEADASAEATKTLFNHKKLCKKGDCLQKYCTLPHLKVTGHKIQTKNSNKTSIFIAWYRCINFLHNRLILNGLRKAL